MVGFVTRTRTTLAAISVIATGLIGGQATAQTHEISLYGGFQSSPHSVVDFIDENGADQGFTAGWEGRPFELPPYYGFRYTYWTDGAWGFGAEMNHAKVYADDATMNATGFRDLEFTDGLNIITANAYYRFSDLGPGITPYLGGGVGFAMPHVDVTTPLGGRTFGYQVTGAAVTAIVGARYEFTENWAVFGEYKGTYSLNSAELAGGATLSTNIITNAFNLGVGYRF